MKRLCLRITSFAIDVAYVVVLLAAFPFIIIRLKKAGYRFSSAAKPVSGCVLFRAASVGEITLVKPLVEELSKEYPVVIATNTSAAVERAAKLYGGNVTVVFAPLDFSFLVRRFYSSYKPRLVMLVEQELWPNFVMCSPAPIVIVNARFSARTARLYRAIRFASARWFRGFFRRIYCSNKATFELISSLAGDAACYSGNLKIDAVRIAGEKTEKEGPFVIAVANTHEGEESGILAAIREAAGPAEIKLYVAPRHVARAGRVSSLAQEAGFSTSMYSSGTDAVAVIVDKIGVLNAIYERADLVVMGGSFVDKGGHNFLEPAAFSSAIVIGPYFDNFRDEALYFEGRNAILRAYNFEGLKMHLKRLLNDRDEARRLGRLAKQTLSELQGVGAVILSDLKAILKEVR